MNNVNQIRNHLAKLLYPEDINENLSIKDAIKEMHSIFLEDKYPGISLEIKKRIRELLNNKDDPDNYTVSKFSESPEVILSSILREIDIDYSNLSFDENVNNIADIPQQSKEANVNNVPSEYNGTI
jgi:hypothetical protein